MITYVCAVKLRFGTEVFMIVSGHIGLVMLQQLLFSQCPLGAFYFVCIIIFASVGFVSDTDYNFCESESGW